METAAVDIMEERNSWRLLMVHKSWRSLPNETNVEVAAGAKLVEDATEAGTHIKLWRLLPEQNSWRCCCCFCWDKNLGGREWQRDDSASSSEWMRWLKVASHRLIPSPKCVELGAITANISGRRNQPLARATCPLLYPTCVTRGAREASALSGCSILWSIKFRILRTESWIRRSEEGWDKSGNENLRS